VQADPRESAAAAADLIKAVNHPIRRAILRHLHRAGPCTASQVNQAIVTFADETAVNFHLKTLVKAGAVTRCTPSTGRGSTFSFNEAACADWFMEVLKLTAGED
jgi:DNA-binding transcriptional ArsR family regulator